MRKLKNNIIPTYTIAYQPHYLEQLFEAEELEPFSFGVEMVLFKGVVQQFLCTPPLLRLEKQAKRNIFIDGKISPYETFLCLPSHLPLYTKLNASMWLYLAQMNDLLLDDEEIYIQLLFQKYLNWHQQGLDLYESYLKGNNYPTTSPIIRKVQESVVKQLDRISGYQKPKPIADVEDKIIDQGYFVQLIILVNAEKKREKILIQTIKEIFKRYDGYNQLRIGRGSRHTITKFQQRIIQTDMVLSLTEIKALFNMQKQSIKQQDINIQPSTLPTIPQKDIPIDDSVLNRLKTALQRTGVIEDTLPNPIIQSGARLMKVTMDIPMDKNYTFIERKTRDIQAILGVEGLSVVQGDKGGTVAFILPHNHMQMIMLGDLIERDDFKEFQQKNPLAFIMGVNEVNEPIYFSLGEVKNLLVAGTIGSGKSEFVKQVATTLMLAHEPSELRLYLIDPKQVELQFLDHFPHVSKLMTDMEEATKLFELLIGEMEKRYELFKESGVNHIETYNQKQEKIPYLVTIIDEYADLVMQEPKIEENIIRLGQMGRAAGIHFIIATQRPSKDIISSKLTANLPNAVSFNLNNNTNYKTVFGSGIPYTLLGKGDGVFKVEGWYKEFQRFQSPIVVADKSQEEKIFKQLGNQFKESEVYELKKVESELERLKRIIANTRETRATILREEMKVGHERLSELLTQLVTEGWLIKHKSKARGYELIATEEMLGEYKVH